jgi:hypothetical protein
MVRANRLARLACERAQRASVGAAEKEALAAGNAHVAQHDQVRGVLDAFGHEPRAARLREMLHGAHGFEFERVVGDVVNEEAVDLHHVGLQLHPEVEARVGGAVVVEGELRAGLAQGLDDGREVAQIVDGALLGQFDHDARGVDRTVEERKGFIAGGGELAQRFGAEVEEQLAGAVERRERLDAGAGRRAL